MQITLNITEDSKVDLVRENCELVQGECCFSEFVFNFPETIKGVAIGEYTKFVEFAECKDLGECVKFVDEIKGDKYELHEACTAFKKIMVQVVLERNADGKLIRWKTVPFSLEFTESVNANGTTAIQAQLLCLTKIRDEWQADFENTKAEWEAFVNANCFKVVYSSSNIPLANTESEGNTIFYLGENTGDFTYGHYYRCTSGAWRDLTQDPSLEGVANGVREINESRTMQFWVGEYEKMKELSADDLPPNVIAVMSGLENCSLPLRKLLFENENGVSVGVEDPSEELPIEIYATEENLLDKTFEVELLMPNGTRTTTKFSANALNSLVVGYSIVSYGSGIKSSVVELAITKSGSNYCIAGMAYTTRMYYVSGGGGFDGGFAREITDWDVKVTRVWEIIE